MTITKLIFYIFSSIAVFSASMVVISRHPVRGVLFLILTFFAMAGVWLLLQAEFLALILVLVYVGAVMTLFLFVVMMLQVNVVNLKAGLVRALPFVILILLMMVGLSIMVVAPERFGLDVVSPPVPDAPHVNNTQALGMLLYTDYVYPFEIAAVLLLAAIVAAISLSHRKPRERKAQNPHKQIAIRREDRVKLLDLPSEKKLSLSEERSS